MALILADILSLSQHLDTLKHTPERYLPDQCRYCCHPVVWRHGVYYRKPDRLNNSARSLNDIPIPRFRCADCKQTFHVLPECIAPRRWYPWILQQFALACLLANQSVRQLSRTLSIARSTLKRWRHGWVAGFECHRRTLSAVHSCMGYCTEISRFWPQWLATRFLSSAMWWLNREGVDIP